MSRKLYSFSVRSLLATTALAAGLVAFSPAQSMTLNEAVMVAVSSNPEVGVALKEHNATSFDVRAAEAGFYPTLDMNAQYGPEYTSSVTTRARAGNKDPILPRSQVGLTARQLLWDGQATVANVDRAESRMEAASHRVAESAEFVGLDAIEAYLEVLRRQQLLALAQGNVRDHEEYLSMVQRRMDAGRGNVADLRQAESRLGNARATLTEASGNLADAQAIYQRVIGEIPQGLSYPSFPHDMFPRDVEHAVALARVANPTVNIATAEVAVSDADVDISEAAYHPVFNLEVNANHRKNNDAVRGIDREVQGLVTMRWNLYRGGGDVARERAAIQRHSRSRDNLDRIAREVEQRTRTDWNGFSTARNRSFDLRKVVEANQRVRDAYLAQFDIGQRSLLDLLDSENELFNARGTLITAEFSTLLSAYRVLAQTGQLLTALNIVTPVEKRTASN